MVKLDIHRKRVNEKRLVLVNACEAFQRAASLRPLNYLTALTNDERAALEYLREALDEFHEEWTGAIEQKDQTVEIEIDDKRKIRVKVLFVTAEQMAEGGDAISWAGEALPLGTSRIPVVGLICEVVERNGC